MISNDSPITGPNEDQFGVDPFARAIATAIEKLSAPEGTVLALTGPWGSGKSSVANLIRHHLRSAEGDGHLKIISFNPWWYSDENLLTRGFFQHIYAGLGQALSEKARSIILALSKKLLTAGPLISTAVNYFTFGFGGQVAEHAASAAAEFIKAERTPEEEFRLLSDELRNQKMRFLVVIDDIDRLTPEQTLLVFRLVKSVGRLANVIYLLVFDRDLAERLMAERYPAERHFLEKIVQAAFEVPLPDPEVLHESILGTLVEFAGHPEGEDGVRFRNVLIDVVNPLISLPRDLGRFIGNLSVSWAAVGSEVDVADLAAIEALRLFRLPMYQTIRSHKGMLCGTGGTYGRQQNERDIYDALFLSTVTGDRERDIARTALRRLFPRLDSIWSNVHYGSSGTTWRAKRRICDPGHFETYFRLALGTDVLPRRVLEGLLGSLGDREKIKTFFRERAGVQRKDGRSDVPIVLDDLIASSERIERAHIGPLLSALFEVADEIDLARDEERPGGGIGGAQLRIHWLINEILRDRLPQTERSDILREIAPAACLGWAVSLTNRLLTEHHPRQHEQPTPSDERLADERTTSELVQLTLGQLRKAASNGDLLLLRSFFWILYRWREFSDAAEVRQWTDSQLSSDTFVLRMAEEATSVSWVSGMGFDGMGDRVSRAVTRVQLDGLDTILDVDRFLSRLEEVEERQLNDHDQQVLSRFREGMRNREEEQRRGRRRVAAAEPPDADDDKAGEEEASN